MAAPFAMTDVDIVSMMMAGGQTNTLAKPAGGAGGTAAPPPRVTRVTGGTHALTPTIMAAAAVQGGSGYETSATTYGAWSHGHKYGKQGSETVPETVKLVRPPPTPPSPAPPNLLPQPLLERPCSSAPRMSGGAPLTPA